MFLLTEPNAHELHSARKEVKKRGGGYNLKGQNQVNHLSSCCCRISVRVITVGKGNRAEEMIVFLADDHLKRRC